MPSEKGYSADKLSVSPRNMTYEAPDWKNLITRSLGPNLLCCLLFMSPQIFVFVHSLYLPHTPRLIQEILNRKPLQNANIVYPIKEHIWEIGISRYGKPFPTIDYFANFI